jgi:hypothetical protein
MAVRIAATAIVTISSTSVKPALLERQCRSVVPWILM